MPIYRARKEFSHSQKVLTAFGKENILIRERLKTDAVGQSLKYEAVRLKVTSTAVLAGSPSPNTSTEAKHLLDTLNHFGPVKNVRL